MFSCSLGVLVSFHTSLTFLQDTRAPSITSPAVPTTVQCDGSDNTADLQQFLTGRGQAEASDACGAVGWTNNYQTLHRVCGNSRSALITFTAADPCGNTNTTAATFFITVRLFIGVWCFVFALFTLT